MKTLQLTLKKKWFDMIASGEKKEEYREMKQYWIDRLCECLDPYFEPEAYFKQFDTVVFKNGYANNTPTIVVECLGIYDGVGKPEWGAPPEEVFIIKLGKILTPAP